MVRWSVAISASSSAMRLMSRSSRGVVAASGLQKERPASSARRHWTRGGYHLLPLRNLELDDVGNGDGLRQNDARAVFGQVAHQASRLAASFVEINDAAQKALVAPAGSAFVHFHPRGGQPRPDSAVDDVNTRLPLAKAAANACANAACLGRGPGFDTAIRMKARERRDANDAEPRRESSRSWRKLSVSRRRPRLFL